MMDDTQGTPDVGPARAKAAQDLSVPAILMMVMGGFWLLYSLYGLVSAGSSEAQMDAINTALAQYPPELQEKMRGLVATFTSTGFRLLTTLPVLLLNAVLVFGAWKMKNLQSYGLAMTAAIISCIPCCGPCCGLGLIPGIWSLVVLNRADVKAAFR